MEGWEKTKGLQQRQRQVLVWVWFQAHQRSEQAVEADYLADWHGEVQEMFHLGMTRQEVMATPGYYLYVEDLIAWHGGRPAVAWSTNRFLGRSPTRSESSTISECLRGLRDRKLVQLIRRGKSKYVSHVRLTEIGQAWASGFYKGWGDHILAEAPLPPGGVPQPPPESES